MSVAERQVKPPLVAHVIYALDTGGLENGLINIINRCPPERYRHAIICLTRAESFSKRLTAPGVEVVELHKKPGHDLGMYWRLWRTLRRLRPAIVHSRNLAALETQVLGILMPACKRVHGEHGRDVNDLDGNNRKYLALRRILRPLIHRFITVSQNLADWLVDTVGIPAAKVTQIYNGVDHARFSPPTGDNRAVSVRSGTELPAGCPEGFLQPGSRVIGTVGRLAAVKDQLLLVRALAHIVSAQPEQRALLRCIIVGEGPEREVLEKSVIGHGLGACVWLAGDRDDIPALLASMDVFVLPSLSEGISNTVLEAMATGLPVIATAVGGNPELVLDGITGTLVPGGDVPALAQAITALTDDPDQRQRMGAAAVQRILDNFDWERTVVAYLQVYDELLLHPRLQQRIEQDLTMCGIAGIFDLQGSREPDRQLLHAMNQSQFHRGPDEGGLHTEPGVGLAHRRLSIIDLASGQQPMFSSDRNLCVVYNGEIYNFRELARELVGLGHVFRTHCDTEVILYAWQQWGERCVEHFRGMFAFALYDRRAQSLFLARDRFGIKPLFYSVLPDHQLLFGSELKVLKAHPLLPRQLQPQAVEDYFALGYVPEPKTIYRDVYKLPPGHSLLLRRGHPVPDQQQYWDIPFQPVAVASEAALEDELLARLREAVEVRLVSEVPLGAFLSGGVDSSAVVAMMAQLQQEPVNTCAIGFDVKQFDETEYATMVANKYRTNHFEQTVSSEDFDLLDQLAALYDEPFADSSAIPTYRVCQLAKQRVTVALSGDGGDEHFAGYHRYRWHMNEERLRSALPLGLRRPLFGTLGRLYPKADWAPRVFRAKTTFQALARDSVQAYLHSVSIFSAEQRAAMFSDDLNRELQGYNVQGVFDEYAASSPTDDPLSLIQYLDMKTYLVGDILTKVDRASMAHALEVRVPFLDHCFTEWVSGLPAGWKLRGQEGKYLLKKSLEPHLPNDVLYRPKMGFGVPLGKWFRGPLKARLRRDLLESGLADTGLFKHAYLERLVEEHQSGRRDHSSPLWSLLMFQAAIRDDAFALGG